MTCSQATCTVLNCPCSSATYKPPKTWVVTNEPPKIGCIEHDFVPYPDWERGQPSSRRIFCKKCGDTRAL